MSTWPITDKEAAAELPDWLSRSEVDVWLSGRWPDEMPHSTFYGRREWFSRDDVLRLSSGRGDAKAVIRYAEWAAKNREKNRLRTSADQPLVYFIEAKELARVKIGWTNRLRERLGQLSRASPVELGVIHWEVGDRHTERDLHERFSGLRLHGEWFRLEADILEHIDARICALHPRSNRPPPLSRSEAV